MKKITKFIFVLVVMIAWCSMTNASSLADPATSAPTPPARTSAQVVSIFSDAYPNAAGSTNFNPGWGQATVQSMILIGSDNVIKYANLNYQGTEFGNHVNAADMTFMHVDVFTTDETSLQITPISPGHELLYTFPTLIQNSWNSYDIPLSVFTGVVMSDLFQIKVVGTSGKTVYLDNIYFYTTATDNQAPTAFTATKGTVASDAVELLLNATDNSGAVFYEITYNSNTVITSGASGVQKSFLISGLNGSTDYNFSVVAKDRTGNAVGTPIVVSATTLTSIPSAPTPTKDAATVISIFSDAYTNVAGVNFNPGWGQSTVQSMVQLGGNNTIKYANLNYQGTEFPTVDASAMNKLHVDVYPIDETSLQVTPISPGKELLVALTPLPLNTWTGYDIPLSSFTGVNKAAIYQFKFVGSGGKTVYLDNLYFFNDASTGFSKVDVDKGISCFPNPIVNKLTISAKSDISQVIVRNLLGQSVKSVRMNGVSGTIDLTGIASGNYIVTVELVNGELVNQKIVRL